MSQRARYIESSARIYQMREMSRFGAFLPILRAQLQRKNEQPLGSRKRSQAVPRRTSCMMTCARRARTRSCQASAWLKNGRLWRYRRSASSRCAMVAHKFRDGRSHARSRTSMWRFTHTRSVRERANAQENERGQCLFLRKYSKKRSVSEVSSLIWNIALYGIEASYSY